MNEKKLSAIEALDEISDAESEFTIGKVLAEIGKQWNGPKGFVAQLKLDFDTCPVGHVNRIRMESDILRILGVKKGGPDDLPNDIETLKAMALKLIDANDE